MANLHFLLCTPFSPIIDLFLNFDILGKKSHYDGLHVLFIPISNRVLGFKVLRLVLRQSCSVC